MSPSWHSSFTRMKMKPHVLVVCPVAVGPAWGKTVSLVNCGAVQPWRHQAEAAEWARGRPASMLAADMGTGKSLTAILATLGERRGLECVQLTTGPTKKRAGTLAARLATAGSRPHVVVVNYESVWRGELGKVIADIKWQAIVLDESHRVKSPTGRASKWLARLAASQPLARRLCLTGTPMPQSPLDIFGQFRFLDESWLGRSFVRFRSRYAECDARFPGMVRRWLNQDELTAIVDAHAWRVSADEVLDLPDVIHERLPVALSPKTARFIRGLESDMVADIEAGSVTAGNPLTRLLRMQQATGGHTRLDGETATRPIDGVPDKRAVLADWLSDLPETEPVVVFARFRGDLAEIAATARALGRPYAELSGESNGLDAWQNGDATILGVQIQSGNAGIDLTRAAYACYYSLGFSLGDYEQSLARLRRPGQRRCVRYYHLVATGTIDEHVYSALQERRDVIDAVLGGLSRRVQPVA